MIEGKFRVDILEGKKDRRSSSFRRNSTRAKNGKYENGEVADKGRKREEVARPKHEENDEVSPAFSR